jgi:Predicted pPIWI-associating nuclease
MAQGEMVEKTVGALHGNVHDIHNRVIKAIQALNKYTHVRPGSVITDQIQIDKFATDTFNAFQELFYVRKFCHSLIISAMHRRHSKALHSFVSRSFAAHDEIKSQTDLESPDLEEFAVDGMGPSFIFFRVEGALNDTLRFRIKMKSPVGKLGALRKISVEINEQEFPAEEC